MLQTQIFRHTRRSIIPNITIILCRRRVVSVPLLKKAGTTDDNFITRLCLQFLSDVIWYTAMVPPGPSGPHDLNTWTLGTSCCLKHLVFKSDYKQFITKFLNLLNLRVIFIIFKGLNLKFVQKFNYLLVLFYCQVNLFFSIIFTYLLFYSIFDDTVKVY